MARLVPTWSLGDKQCMQPGVLVRAAARSILDFALPPRCPSCGAVTTLPHSFCVDCWTGLHFLVDPCCARCGLPFAYDQGADAECGACLAHPPHYDRLRSAVAYGAIARRIALKLKYGGRPGVAETLAAFMDRHLQESAADAILVPVPLHRWRIWKRGYNQAALIASALGRRTGRAVELDLLQRVRSTPSMRGLGARERARVVRGAFAVRDGMQPQLEGRSIILVDDIYTSGTTANACALALKRAGARSVNIVCWARVIADDDG
jgi:ComF family protein